MLLDLELELTASLGNLKEMMITKLIEYKLLLAIYKVKTINNEQQIKSDDSNKSKNSNDNNNINNNSDTHKKKQT